MKIETTKPATKSKNAGRGKGITKGATKGVVHIDPDEIDEAPVKSSKRSNAFRIVDREATGQTTNSVKYSAFDADGFGTVIYVPKSALLKDGRTEAPDIRVTVELL